MAPTLDHQWLTAQFGAAPQRDVCCVQSTTRRQPKVLPTRQLPQYLGDYSSRWNAWWVVTCHEHATPHQQPIGQLKIGDERLVQSAVDSAPEFPPLFFSSM